MLNNFSKNIFISIHSLDVAKTPFVIPIHIVNNLKVSSPFILPHFLWNEELTLTHTHTHTHTHTEIRLLEIILSYQRYNVRLG